MDPVESFVEVDGGKFVDDGSGQPKLDDAGERIPYVEPQKDEMVPKEQFNKVYGKMKDFERKLTELEKGKKEGTLTPEQEKEFQAKTYLKNLLKETLDETQKERDARERADLESFKTEVEEVLDANTDVKREDFMKFLEEDGDDYSSVAAAIKGYKRLHETAEDAADKAKKGEQRKPRMPKSEGEGSEPRDYEKEDKGKSLWQVAQDAAREFMNKK